MTSEDDATLTVSSLDIGAGCTFSTLGKGSYERAASTGAHNTHAVRAAATTVTGIHSMGRNSRVSARREAA